MNEEYIIHIAVRKNNWFNRNINILSDFQRPIKSKENEVRITAKIMDTIDEAMKPTKHNSG